MHPLFDQEITTPPGLGTRLAVWKHLESFRINGDDGGQAIISEHEEVYLLAMAAFPQRNKDFLDPSLFLSCSFLIRNLCHGNPFK